MSTSLCFGIGAVASLRSSSDAGSSACCQGRSAKRQSCCNAVSWFKRRRAGRGEGLTVKQNAGAASRPGLGGRFFLGRCNINSAWSTVAIMPKYICLAVSPDFLNQTNYAGCIRSPFFVLITRIEHSLPADTIRGYPAASGATSLSLHESPANYLNIIEPAAMRVGSRHGRCRRVSTLRTTLDRRPMLIQRGRDDGKTVR
ncbi:hypothetical protein Rleg4DRAFT_7050 [Rhizobium leguminosarum bv. trifolii WSM2297]|uniref:Uncharacterized protein n=1 Tax=Rhizobium leguminosarum bv. trifolii WSM2297 TaxID=754762 RepID=J0WGN5_RHILT|nr:hypothetical protein Rleg4DRAFT_4972 [Rhizobium leguminosarum bv. trifolii WSM2297]EJC85176.1 hypothetical protein Rleg4DRAFT_7050 [Rhizobium leguminosarum bv. trifolii WSM2297]